MKNVKFNSGNFKNGRWHLIPNFIIAIEFMQKGIAVDFEISFLYWTLYAEFIFKKLNEGKTAKCGEVCPCCDGTGICTDIDNEEGACITCGGSGHTS
jgi:hypothetical protein